MSVIESMRKVGIITINSLKSMTDNKINQKYQTIVMYEQRMINVKGAASSLGIGERQFFRVLKRFRESGRKIEGFQFQSHEAWNRTKKETEEKILKLNREYQEALNFHLSWLAWDLYQEKIQPFTIRNILLRYGTYTPYKEKRERAYKKFAATHFGALVQLDTADGYWLKGYPLLHFIIAVDDASRTPLAGGFYDHDSTLNNMLVIKEIIRKHGVPALFYTDNDSKFKVIRHGTSRYQTYKEEVLAGETITEIRRALAEVGSGLITHAPFHPQGKGKVEKFIRFVQDCFLKNHRATTLEELNKDFQRWLKWYDQRGHRTLGEAPQLTREKLIKAKKVAFRPLSKGIDLDAVFTVKEERKPNKYNIFRYQGKEYQLPLEKVCCPGKVELRILPDNRIRVFNKERELIAELKS